MKILTKLTGTPADAPNLPRKGIRMGYDKEVSPGQFIFHKITDAGLLLESGKEQILIPLEELQALAASHNPHFNLRSRK